MADATTPTPDDDAPAAPRSPWIKPLLELGPILVFFVAFSIWDIFVATAVFMVLIVASLTITRLRERRWPPMLLVTAVVVLVFGGLTLWLRDETFVKLKLTVINGLFGLALLAGMLFRKPLIKVMLGEVIRLTDEGWRQLTWAWTGYFFAIAALNEAVWRNTSTETWVTFKTFALPALSVLFILAQAPVMAKHDLSEREPESEPGA